MDRGVEAVPIMGARATRTHRRRTLSPSGSRFHRRPSGSQTGLEAEELVRSGVAVTCQSWRYQAVEPDQCASGAGVPTIPADSSPTDLDLGPGDIHDVINHNARLDGME
jgi:hypothetical protein